MEKMLLIGKALLELAIIAVVMIAVARPFQIHRELYIFCKCRCKSTNRKPAFQLF